jgi:hypothetical protein
MAPRRFAIGDRVRLSLDAPATHNPLDVYTISRALPARENVWQYRVKREDDGRERAVNESQIVKEPPQLTDRAQFEAQRDLQRERNTNALGRARSAARRQHQNGSEAA